MAKKLHKSARGVEADLCSTIYRYVEQLTKQPLNTLKNWRDISEWLEQTGYKIQVFDSVDGEKAIASSPSEDIEALVQKVRSHFNKTIQDQCANLCTFNLSYTPMLGNLSRMYVQTKLNEAQGFGAGEFSQERQLWDEVLLRHSKLMVLGKPGAGKTTLLQYIALNCDEIEFQPKLVPIFISLETLAENAKPPDEIDILGYIQNKYCCSNVSEQELESLLNHGRLLFLLDGLDEVTEEKISVVNSQINNLVDLYSNNRFIVSCRKEFQAYQSKKFAHFGFCLVADFEKTQRDDFIKQGFDEVAVIAQPKRSVKANDLIKKLDRPENQRILELADTPLLLHLICLIFQERGDLPSKRVELYREAIDLLLEKWNQFNERLYINVIELKKALRRIAAITFEAGKSSFEESEISPIIANCPQTLSNTEVLSGLIVKKGWKQYAFSHQTFQEYLIAEDCVSSQQCWRTLLVHLTETRWREIFFLAVEMGNDTDLFLRLFKQGVQDLIDECEQWWSDESESWVSNIDDSYSGFLDASLTKVNQKLTDVKKDYKIIAIRAFYFMASIIISPVYSMESEFVAFNSSCIYSGSQKSEVCPMPYALCPMPYAQSYLIFLRKAI
ncbi:NACHT domain-containing protein [Microcoleus vaginatus DQ-U2]|uniref:NACHT domain-containing protein n=1 Tax=Microcoleus vaginatus TaxID=119532 RepID=UPI001689953A|nr:NACHT domain-containing protein [Microcoleus sp. FACHB-DQ6]